MQPEEYKIIADFPDYSVSNLGNIKNNITGLIMKQCTDRDGYKKIELRNNGTRKQFKSHRLVAIAFIENPENKPLTDHKDNNPANNNVNNLRWATRAENCRNCKVNVRNKLGVKGVSKRGNKYKAVIGCDGKTIVIGTYTTIEEATEARRIKANELFKEFTYHAEKMAVVVEQINNLV